MSESFAQTAARQATFMIDKVNVTPLSMDTPRLVMTDEEHHTQARRAAKTLPSQMPSWELMNTTQVNARQDSRRHFPLDTI